VTSPDNPSGYCPPARELAELARGLPPGALLVVDEAYMDFAAYGNGVHNSRLAEFSLLPRLHEFPNVAVLRTFSKTYGLAGLRLGYGLMPAELAGYLRRARLPFSVNILAEAAGLAALKDSAFRLATLEAVERGREYLGREFRAMGFLVWPSRSNFLLLKPPANSSLYAEELFEALLRQGIILRYLKSYGLPEFLRVSVGNAEENSLLIEAVRGLLP
jgi:histidinol-phosphate aminotransferase